MGFPIFVTATNTGIGKTFFSYLLCSSLKDLGYKVGYWKPVETGANPYPQDAKLLSELLNQPLEETVTYTFQLPLAPAVAEKYEGEKIEIERLKGIYYQKLKAFDLLVIEGAGGLAVPIKGNYTYGNFAKELNLSVLIVSDAKLGTINCSFLTAFYGKSLKLNLIGFVFNRFTGEDFSERDNPSVVEKLTGLKVWFKIPKTDLRNYKLEEETLKEFLKKIKG
ncbi:MAG TPA: dethiobiotin synthase [Aquifex aeolicus]|nr:dethiobiotin synthase [Aquificales bacterium]HIQ26768.1 dethiobiotin synthase [Aquifex aeolicus]